MLEVDDALGWAAQPLARRMADVRHLYHLTVRRDVESDTVARDLSGWIFTDLLRGFVGSEEFLARIVSPLRRRRSPWPLHGHGPGRDLTTWAAKTLPLTAGGRRKVKAAADRWAALYAALLGDPVFRATLGDAALWLTSEVEGSLHAAAGVAAAVDRFEGRRLEGWVVALDQAALTVELWVNGAFMGAARPDQFRRDVQHDYGGDGLVGFELVLPAGYDPGLRSLDIEVRLAPSGLVIAEQTLVVEQAAPDELILLRREAAEVRRLLESVEARLPRLSASLAAPLAEYDFHRRMWGGVAPLEGPSRLSLVVVIDGVDASPAWIEASVWKAVAHDLTGLSVTLIIDESQVLAARDLAQRVQWRLGREVTLRIDPSREVSLRFLGALEGSSEDLVLVMKADSVLEPGALNVIARRFESEPGLAALSFDEDAFDPQDEAIDPDARRRISPLLKPSFDVDLLLQSPYVGPGVAFRREALQQFGLRAEAGSLRIPDLVLRLALDGREVGHEPQVLWTRHVAEGPVGPGWLACVAAAVGSDPTIAGVEFGRDVLGADVPGAVRIRRRPLPGARARIIIPTRDGLAMLRPCLDSVEHARTTNETGFDVVVIDHASGSSTADFLAERESAGALRVMPFAGDFNWALMNNLAAADTNDAEVLVFLNDDTTVLTPDWLDALTAQALRADVGAVGCRLLYEDGALQHAGFVARDGRDRFMVHEGVGLPGSDPGYMGRHALAHSTVAVTGACMAVRSDVFRRLGGFDAAHLPVEGNDVDFCMRAQAEGLKVIYEPHATLYHRESKTRGFNRTPQQFESAAAAARTVWERWGERFGRDPRYHPRFDRLSRPFSRLAPPTGR